MDRSVNLPMPQVQNYPDGQMSIFLYCRGKIILMDESIRYPNHSGNIDVPVLRSKITAVAVIQECPGPYG